MKKFGIGQSIRRVEDVRLLTGEGCYTDDIRPEGAAFGAVVRSPHAHANILSIDSEDAQQVEGVLAVYTHADLDAAGVKDIPCMTLLPGKEGKKPISPGHPVLARGKVRHVGDPVAFVVAETLEAAQEAAELVMVDYEDLDAVVDPAKALEPGAPNLHEAAPDNLSFTWDMGEEAETEAALAAAERVVEIEVINNRIVVNSMEPRNAIGEYEAGEDRLTLTTTTQGVFSLRNQISERILGIPVEKLRVKTPDVGGGFGMKLFVYSEQVLVLFAARALGRPVVWNGTRGECFQSDSQGRDFVNRLKAGFDAEGKITALKIDNLANLGGYLSNFSIYVATMAGARMFSGVYDIPKLYAQVRCVFTNTVPVDAYRGAGRPEAAYMLERLMDKAARELGMTREEIRFKNFIPASAMPYKTQTGMTYDSGDFAMILGRALEKSDYAGAAARKAEAARRGNFRGIGIGYYIEACAGVGQEEARVRLDEDGGMTVFVGTQSNGQGHATAYAQIMAERFGVALEKLRVKQGDSDDLTSGGGTGGSRSLLMGRLAIEGASDKVLERLKQIAGHLLEAAPQDIEMGEGSLSVVGTDKRVTLEGVAKAVYAGDLPEELGGELAETYNTTAPPLTYPNGCHIVELEIEGDTGELSIERYTVVDDFGTLVNPMMAAGQVHGGIAQGLGQALLELTAYDESGQLLTGSFMDYGMPRADNLPEIDLEFVQEVPCATNPFGIKGAGEAGAIGAPPAIMGALLDALAPLGVTELDMPATPAKLWSLIQQSKAAAE
ncbi:xanthine dehydrogenase family protein molybdopterin-binding subunit [Limibacillus halophilus]